MQLTRVHLDFLRTRKIKPKWAADFKTQCVSIDDCVNAHAGIREKDFTVHNAINTLQMGARNCRRATGTTTPYRDYLTKRILRYGTSTTKTAEIRLLLRIAKKIGVTQNVVLMLIAAMQFRQQFTNNQQHSRS